MKYQTDLSTVFEPILEYVMNLVWVIAGHNFNYIDNECIDVRLNPKEDFIRLPGNELIEIVNNTKIQFKWGVLSGCKAIPDINNFDYDKWGLKNYSAEGYVYDDAEIEIDCYNGLFTIIRTERREIIEKLSDYFKCAING